MEARPLPRLPCRVTWCGVLRGLGGDFFPSPARGQFSPLSEHGFLEPECGGILSRSCCTEFIVHLHTPKLVLRLRSRVARQCADFRPQLPAGVDAAESQVAGLCEGYAPPSLLAPCSCWSGGGLGGSVTLPLPCCSDPGGALPRRPRRLAWVGIRVLGAKLRSVERSFV